LRSPAAASPLHLLAADGASYKIHWDKREGSGNWQPLCDLTARRVR
jgi:hypothetical protein